MTDIVCPRCNRRMSARWMDAARPSVHDGETLICDICSVSEELEAGFHDAKLSHKVAKYDGEPYWKTTHSTAI